MGSISESKSPECKCIGKVNLDKLEEHVPNSWWIPFFNDPFYLLTDGDVVEDPKITTEEVKLLESYDCVQKVLNTPGANVLDLCCGQGRHALLLAQLYPHINIYGHDQSTALIEMATERANDLKQNRKPVFTVGDALNIPHASEFFDLVIVMGNSFGYFRNELDNMAFLSEISRVTKKGTGVVVLDNTDGAYVRANYQPMSWEWLGDEIFVARERTFSADGCRLVCRAMITHVKHGVLMDKLYEEWIYEESQIWKMLNSVGIVEDKAQGRRTEVTPGKNMSTLKDPDQDLGMMGHRLLSVGKCANNIS